MKHGKRTTGWALSLILMLGLGAFALACNTAEEDIPEEEVSESAHSGTDGDHCSAHAPNVLGYCPSGCEKCSSPGGSYCAKSCIL
jgi:hypothetical protein